MNTVSELKPMIIKPVMDVKNKIVGYDKHEKYVVEAADKVVGYADKAGKFIDDNVGYCVTEGFDYMNKLVSPLFSGLGEGFVNSKGQIPTPFEMLGSRCLGQGCCCCR